MNETERGDKAKRLLEDPVLKQAFADVRARIIAEFENAPLRDQEGIFNLRLMLKALNDVRANLERAVRDGRLERIRMEEKQRGR